MVLKLVYGCFLLCSTGKDGVQKDYYTLDCILFLLKNVSLAHAMYVRQAAVRLCFHCHIIELKQFHKKLDQTTNFMLAGQAESVHGPVEMNSNKMCHNSCTSDNIQMST